MMFVSRDDVNCRGHLANVMPSILRNFIMNVKA